MSSWINYKLGDVCKFEGGSQPPKKEFSNEKLPNYVRLIQIRDYKSDNNIVYIPIEKAKRFCNEDDIMIGRYGPPVFQILKGLKGAYNVALMKAIPNEKILTKEYAFIFLKYSNVHDYIVHLSQRAAGQTGVNKNALAEYPIQLPSVAEQKRIVAILDKSFAAIDKAKANAEKNLKNAQELFESYLYEVFSKSGKDWEKKTLGEIIQYDKVQDKYKRLPYVGLENIESNTGKFIGSLDPQEVKSSTFYFTNKHLLYGRLRPYLNKVLLPNFEGHCSTEIFPILVSENLKREFLFYWLISEKTVKKIDATWTGARMPRANMKEVLNFYFLLPPLKEQSNIIKKLNAISLETKRLEIVYQKKINDLEELKRSLLQKAFKGEL